MKGYKRHKFLFGFLRVTLGWIFKLKFNAKFERFGNDGEPYMIIANHTANYDPIFAGIACKGHTYFVASEHLSRKGLLSKLLEWVFSPISRMKGGTDGQAAMSIIRRIRKGANVCMFAEGSRPFDGVTLPIYSATGKLVKSSGVKLITYKFKGGYFSNPRWGRGLRRGRMTGEIVAQYPPEQLKKMTPEEVNDVLVRDLYEDAYETQKQEPVAYKGRRLAEYLQAALYICPDCGGIDTLQTKGNRFWCDCGLNGIYTPYGYLEGENLKFTTVRDWNRWQLEQLEKLAQELDEKPVSNDGISIYQVAERGRDKLVAHGRLALYRDRLACEDLSFPIEEIADIAIIGRDKLMMSTKGTYYEIRPDNVYCASKYVDLFLQLKKMR